jgi:hypothetical protein
MGRLLIVHPCPVCNYHVEDELHEGGSGVDVMFLRNHYRLAICADCHELVSVLVPNTNAETAAALETARREIVQLEVEAREGDDRAKGLLPLFRAALNTFDENVPAAVSVCTFCGSTAIEIQPVESALFDAQDAWVRCPRCEEGRLLVETAGTWDQ